MAGGSLADKINYLFETVRRPDGKSYSNEEVAEAITGLGRATISGTYLWYLRRGDRDNPTKKHLEMLAHFFDVSPAFFFDDPRSRQITSDPFPTTADSPTQRPGRDQQPGTDQRPDEGVRPDEDPRWVAAMLYELSPRSLRTVVDLIGRVRELEGLPGNDPGATEPDITEPDITEPDTAEPDTIGQDTAEPDTTRQDITE